MKKSRKFISIFAILFALVFALSVCFFAACGGSDDDEKGSDTTTEQGGDTSGENDNEPEPDPDPDPNPSTATVESVSVAPSTLKLEVGGEGGSLTASVIMSDSSPYSGSYTWASDDTSVASVTGSGSAATVKAVGEGEANITVTLDSGEKAICAVTVSEPEPEITTVTTAEGLEAALEAGGNIALGADITGMFTVVTGKTVTLDLSGYSITDLGEDDTNENDTQYTITVEGGAVLTVRDSGAVSEIADGGYGDVTGIICTYPATGTTGSRLGAAIYTRGTLNIESGTLASSSVGIMAENGTTTITGGTVTSEYYTIFEAHGTTTVNVGGDAVVHGTRGIFVSGDSYYGYGASNDPASYDFDAKNYLNIYGDAEVSTTFGSPISTLGYTNRDTAYINISGGTISGRPIEYSDDEMTTEKVTVMPTVYIPNGNLTVSGGTIEGSTAVEFRGGNVSITGGTLKSTSEQPNDPQWNGSGATSYGYALAVYPYAKEGEKNEIEGRTFENALVVEVSGGTFIGPVCENNKYEELEYTFSITGGYFSENPTDCLNDGYKAELNAATGYYEIVADSASGETVSGTGLITVDDLVAAGTLADDATYTSSVVLYSENGTTVAVIASTDKTTVDDDQSGTCAEDGKSFTYRLKLNGTGSASDCSVKLEVTGACTITIYAGSGSSGRVINLYDSNYSNATAFTGSSGVTAKNTIYKYSLTVDAAGTYYIGSVSGGFNLFGVQVAY